MCDNEKVKGPNSVKIPPALPPVARRTAEVDPSESVDGTADGHESGGVTPELFDRVYEQLRDLAHRQMRHERAGLTLQTTALVHEVYLRLMKDPTVTWQNPRHFFGAAAEAMRRILIERARRHRALKHGGGRRRVALDAVLDGHDGDASEAPATDSRYGGGGAAGDAAADDDSASAMLALDTALAELRRQDATLAEVVMLRYFAGLSVEETAAAVGRSPRSVKRDWAFARAWLARRLDGDA